MVAGARRPTLPAAIRRARLDLGFNEVHKAVLVRNTRAGNPAGSNVAQSASRTSYGPRELLDLFGLFFVELRDLVSRAAVVMNKFVEFGVDRLRVSVFGTLDKQRHCPCDQGGKAVPFQCFATEDQP